MLVDDGREWRLIGIYGEPRWEEKEKTWEALRTLHGRIHKLWLALGDFNEILFHHEKEEGRPRELNAFSKRLVKLWMTVAYRTWAIVVTCSPGSEEKSESG